MSKRLLLGYMLCIATLVGMIVLLRQFSPPTNGHITFFCMITGGLLLFLASALCFMGARASTNHIRKALAYSVSGLSLLFGLGSMTATLLAALGAIKLV